MRNVKRYNAVVGIEILAECRYIYYSGTDVVCIGWRFRPTGWHSSTCTAPVLHAEKCCFALCTPACIKPTERFTTLRLADLNRRCEDAEEARPKERIRRIGYRVADSLAGVWQLRCG